MSFTSFAADRIELLSKPDHSLIFNRDSISSYENSIEGPKSLSHDNYICFHSWGKIPIHLKWTHFSGADSYKVQVKRHAKGTTYSKAVYKNSHHVMIEANAKYSWQVTAYKNGKVVGVPSKKYQLYALSGKDNSDPNFFEQNFESHSGKYLRVLHFPRVKQQMAETVFEEKVIEKPVTPVEKIIENVVESEPIQKREVSSFAPDVYSRNFWIKFGIGYNLIDYNQKIEDIGTFQHTSANFPNVYVAAGKNMNENHGVQFSYTLMSIDFEDKSVDLDDSFIWHYGTLDGIYNLKGNHRSKKWRPYLKYGLSYHAINILELEPLSKTVDLVINSLFSLGVGFGLVKSLTDEVHINFNLGYQYPFKGDSSIDAYKLSSGHILDLLVESGYKLSDKSSVNVFINSIYLQTEYSINSSSSKFEGDQKLFNNIFGVNYGYTFD